MIKDGTLSNYTIVQLKSILASAGVKTSSRKKEDLVQQVLEFYSE
jgi:hypothetical protein